MPDPDDAKRLLGLHRRLVDGDRVAPEELAELLLVRLVREVAGEFRRTDTQLVSDAVTDALLDYCARPSSFDASQGIPLDRFVAQAARRNVSNLLRGERRRKTREEKWGESSSEKVVELRPSVGNPMQNEAQTQQRRLDELAQALKDPVDKKIFQLRVKGERRTSEFAKVMGLSHLPEAAQRREVKRAKDRIEKLLQRRKGPRT